MWLSTRQYAGMLGICEESVRRMCRKGRVPVGTIEKVGQLWRIRIEEEAEVTG